MKDLYYPVKLEFLIKDKFFNSDIYLKLGEDYIFYLKEGEDNQKELEKLRDKQCVQVFLNKKGLKEYLELKKNILKKELSKESTPTECLNQFTDNYALLKDFYVGVVDDEFKAAYMQELGSQSLKILESNAYLNTIFTKIKKETPEQVVLKQLISFFAVFSLKYFDHIPDEALEKFNVAILMTDFFLDKEDLKAQYSEYSEDLPSRILEHPKTAVEKLPPGNYFSSSVVIDLIKNHHESPTGKGYPNRISCTRFDIFLCSYVIAERIVFKLVEQDLKLNEVKKVYQEVYQEYRKYATPNFQRAFENFEKFLGKDSKNA